MELFAEGACESVGVMIRQLRLARGLTLEGLAKKVGCVKGYLSAIETGKRPPPETALAERLERELQAPAGVIVRASAWSRTPQRVRAEIESEVWAGRGMVGDRGLWLNGIAGWGSAERVVVVSERVGMGVGMGVGLIQPGDVAVLGGTVALERLEAGCLAGCLVGVEHAGGTTVLWWPSWHKPGVPAGVRGTFVAVRPVLGVCRVFSGEGM